MSSLRTRLRDERGWGLISSVLVLGILVSLSLPLLSLVDTQQVQSAHERKSESSFNLAEAALDATMFVLGKKWPGEAAAYPSECTDATTGFYCPSAELLAGTYTGGDYSNRSWTIQVRDDISGEYYDPAQVPNSLLRYDANKNGKVWVRADARAAHGTRSVVALVRRIDSTVQFPRNAITAGWFRSTNNGNKVIVDTKGKTAQAAPVAVRCPGRGVGCLEYRPGQVSPDTTTVGYGGDTTVAPEVIESFRDKAKELGTYYAGCPASLTGELVFIENGNCTYTGGGQGNSATVPGTLVIANGTLYLGGNVTFYGLVYGANLQRSTGEIVRTQGSAVIVGAVAVDGGGGVSAGSSKLNVVYADGAFRTLTAFTAAAPVQGSWRELPAS